MRMRRMRCMAACERGTAAIEFAIIGLVMMTGSIAALEFGRALYAKNDLSWIADRVARKALLDDEATAEDLAGEAYALFSGNGDELSVVIIEDTFDGAPLRTIRLRRTLRLAIAGLPAPDIELSVTRRAPAR